MAYKIVDIEGIGETYAQKLNEVGIKTTDDLLKKCGARYGRMKISAATGISTKLLLRWTNHADLFRIKGVAGQFAEVLEAAGVDTVKEFRHRKAANLLPRIEAVNAEKNLCNRIPSLTELQKMIDQANKLEPKITY